ncbi:MAG: nucleoside triphosphate pyrophosphohydrolase [Sphingomonadales bacterium]
MTKPRSITDLLAIMARLRNPDGGCPWDVEQDFTTIAPYTIEEAYEVAEAIARRDMDALKDELGDLLFQVVYHARIAEESGAFDFADVVTTVCDKMVRRHPHVFGDSKIENAEAQTQAWESHKAKEREARSSGDEDPASALDGVTLGLPALMRAIKLQRRAARVGFDWPETAQVLDKINEEMAELAAELAECKAESTGDQNSAAHARIEDEFGDLLFVYANLARHLDIDPETALRSANAKFERRFRGIEKLLAEQNKCPEDSDLQEMDSLWNRVKLAERERS